MPAWSPQAASSGRFDTAQHAVAIRLDEMGYTDLGDSLDDMRVRADHRQFNFPFLYDGETQEISKLYGPVATPHIFVFDEERRLRYHGRIDSSPREALAKVPDARNAIDAMLAGTPVAVERTPAIGCSVKWLDKKASRDAEEAGFAKEPVSLEKVTVAQMKALAANTTGKTLLVNFWATWCAPCVDGPLGDRPGPRQGLERRRAVLDGGCAGREGAP